jgi:transcriptional regulator with XRE-family HTH domain
METETAERGAAAFGAELAALREKRGLTIRELARRTDVTATAISEIERGVRDPILSTVERIVAGLGARVTLVGVRRVST